MRIGRAIIIPAILALGVTGPALAASAITAAAPAGHAVHVQATQDPNLYYHL